MEYGKVGFTPNEAARISGMSLDTQRNNRRSGYLAKRSGHARFDLFELLEMTFISDAARFGIGPKFSVDSAEWVAHSALIFALQLPETHGIEQSDPYLETSKMSLAAAVFGRPRIMPNRTAAIWPDGSDYFAPTIDDVNSSLAADDPRRGQPVLIVDTMDFAERVVRRIGKPTLIPAVKRQNPAPDDPA